MPGGGSLLMRRTDLRHLNLTNRVTAEINKLRVAIAEERRNGQTERLRRLQERKSQLTDQFVALEIQAFGAKWR